MSTTSEGSTQPAPPYKLWRRLTTYAVGRLSDVAWVPLAVADTEAEPEALKPTYDLPGCEWRILPAVERPGGQYTPIGMRVNTWTP